MADRVTASDPNGQHDEQAWLNFKRRLSGRLASVLLASPVLERAFVAVCTKPRLRKWFQLGGIAFGYNQVLRRPEIRLAKLGGYAMYVDVSDAMGIETYFYKKALTVWLTRDLLRQGDVCVDAGAFMGHYTMRMASLVGPAGRVIAFEPQPGYRRLILDSVRANNFGRFVHVDERVLWNHSGETVRFYLVEKPRNPATSSAIRHSEYLQESRSITVETVTLTDCLRFLEIRRCRLVKIDVERAEVEVIEGAQAFLADAQLDFIILEMFAGTRAQALLEGNGYRCFWIDQAHRRLVDIRWVEDGLFGDFLFVSPRCAAGFANDYGALIRADRNETRVT